MKEVKKGEDKTLTDKQMADNLGISVAELRRRRNAIITAYKIGMPIVASTQKPVQIHADKDGNTVVIPS